MAGLRASGLAVFGIFFICAHTERHSDWKLGIHAGAVRFMTPLQNSLLASSAFGSFSSEQAVAEVLSKAKWSSTHGFYYEDLLTQKQREVDVIAMQTWKRKQGEVDQSCDIYLLVEVKSMSGFHLLLSEHTMDARSFYNHILWFGDASGKYLELAQKLEQRGIEPKHSRSLISRMHQYAYPRHTARMGSMMVRPQAAQVFTSFRETNIGSDKELESSVLWKAIQSLRSAESALSRQIRGYHIERLMESIEYEPRTQDWVKAILPWAQWELGMVDIVHPVVVTDAKLWSANRAGIEERKSARFSLRTFAGHSEWWCDVVNSSYIKEYVAVVSKHYRRYLRRAKAKHTRA